MITVLTGGAASGRVAVLRTPLSFWGGFDALKGTVMDHHHPDFGLSLTGKVVVMPSGRGSSSGASVVAEAVRLGTAPCAFVLKTADPILLTGLLVAEQLYGKRCPLLVVDESLWQEAALSAEIAVETEGETAILKMR